MIEGRNIICFASNWSYDPTSKHHIMRLLAERNHVIWVNHHGSRRPRLSRSDFGAVASKLAQVIEGPRRIHDGLTVVTPLVAPWPGRAAARRLNRRWLTRQIRGVLRGLPPRPVQLWSFAPDVDYMCGRFDEECVVYYCVDDFASFSGYDREAIRSSEARLASRADLVVTTSRALYEAKRAFNENTVLVTHGVDDEHFARATSAELTVPAEIASLPRPVLGFWGLLQDWIDVELLSDLARARPDWSIVLIGEAATDVSTIASLPNVHLLGRRPYAALPAYAKGFDAGLIPFRVNALTRAVNPIKLREYLAAGLPVVSTPLPEVEAYRDLVHIGEGGGAFVDACVRALEFDSADRCEERQAAMQPETWSSKVEEVSGHVEGAVERKLAALADVGVVGLHSHGTRGDAW